MTHKEKAEQLLKQQYHCSQALFGAFADDFQMNLKTAFKISTCFGGGMRQGGVCGCVSSSLMILGLAMGFYDSQDRDREIYSNQKTEEFIRRFAQRMNGCMNCRDILGKDITNPEDMAVIRKEGLFSRQCPKAIHVSIEILEEMLESYLKDMVESALEVEDIPENQNLKNALLNMNKLHTFRKNVNNLLFSSTRGIGFI